MIVNINFLDEVLGRFICKQNEIKVKSVSFYKTWGAKVLVCFISRNKMLYWFAFFFFGPCNLKAAIWTEAYP